MFVPCALSSPRRNQCNEQQVRRTVNHRLFAEANEQQHTPAHGHCLTGRREPRCMTDIIPERMMILPLPHAAYLLHQNNGRRRRDLGGQAATTYRNKGGIKYFPHFIRCFQRERLRLAHLKARTLPLKGEVFKEGSRQLCQSVPFVWRCSPSHLAP